eukprot:scaffold140491_cov21-Tisochrysis_lutea.AAC.2
MVNCRLGRHAKKNPVHCASAAFGTWLCHDPPKRMLRRTALLGGIDCMIPKRQHQAGCTHHHDCSVSLFWGALLPVGIAHWKTSSHTSSYTFLFSVGTATLIPLTNAYKDVCEPLLRMHPSPWPASQEN